jgi:hypothetical protein
MYIIWAGCKNKKLFFRPQLSESRMRICITTESLGIGGGGVFLLLPHPLALEDYAHHCLHGHIRAGPHVFSFVTQLTWWVSFGSHLIDKSTFTTSSRPVQFCRHLHIQKRNKSKILVSRLKECSLWGKCTGISFLCKRQKELTYSFQESNSVLCNNVDCLMEAPGKTQCDVYC